VNGPLIQGTASQRDHAAPRRTACRGDIGRRSGHAVDRRLIKYKFEPMDLASGRSRSSAMAVGAR
jgi:hypothetical protein